MHAQQPDRLVRRQARRDRQECLGLVEGLTVDGERIRPGLAEPDLDSPQPRRFEVDTPLPWPSSFIDVVEPAVPSPTDRATVRPARGVPSGRSTWSRAVPGWGWMAIAKAVSRPSTTATPSRPGEDRSRLGPLGLVHRR